MFSRSTLFGGVAAMLAALTSAADAGVTSISTTKGPTRLIIQSEDETSTFTFPFGIVTQTPVFAIPATQTGFLVATFTGESQCSANEWCSIVITCDGGILTEPPADTPTGSDFAFNSPGGAESASYTATGRTKPFTGGTHFCVVRSDAVGGGFQRLDDWTFTVEFWQQ